MMSKGDVIVTGVKGTNSKVIANAASLYIRDGDDVLDMTWGKGVFWKEINTSLFNFHRNDIVTLEGNEKKQLGHLDHHEDKSMNVVVLDPPYAHTPGSMIVDKNYQNKATTHAMYHSDIMSQLYARGMVEARRMLKHTGFLFVKCQDEIESGKQKWSHIEIFNIATSMGFYAKDMFVLVQNGTPTIQHKQQHARRNHSYLWVFQRII